MKLRKKYNWLDITTGMSFLKLFQLLLLKNPGSFSKKELKSIDLARGTRFFN